MNADGNMFDTIQKILGEFQRKQLPPDGLTPAAVLVPLFLKDRQTHLLMGRRTDKVLKHKGQISFPGGVRDPEDCDEVACALREAWEEVGLVPEDVTILGKLSDIQTMTGFLVTPVVGSIPYPYEFKLNPLEVEELLQVPWSVFSTRRGHHRETFEHEGDSHEVDFYDFENHIIWGATARITRQLVELVEGPAHTEET
jgi:8-oxo-dGTP pyrophosphatase MutT (NUDIX family)